MAKRSTKATAADMAALGLAKRPTFIGERVRVMRSLGALKLAIGQAGEVIAYTAHAWRDDGRAKVVQVRLDSGAVYWFGSAELGPEKGAVAW